MTFSSREVLYRKYAVGSVREKEVDVTHQFLIPKFSVTSGVEVNEQNIFLLNVTKKTILPLGVCTYFSLKIKLLQLS